MSNRKFNKARGSPSILDLQVANRIDRFVNESEKKGGTAPLYDVDLVTDWLRVHFHDYSRKKKETFRRFVERALVRYIRDHPDKSFDTEAMANSDDSSFGDGGTPISTANIMNTSLANVYRRKSAVATPQSSNAGDNSSGAAARNGATRAAVYDVDRRCVTPGTGDARTKSTTAGSKARTTSGATPLQRAQAAAAEGARLESASVRKRKRSEFIGQRRRNAAAYTGATLSDAPSRAGATASRFGDSGLEASMPGITFADVAGIDDVLQDVEELVHYPLRHPEIYQHLGVDTPCGILLHGAPGCGKTMLAKAIAGEYKLPFFSIAAPEIVSGMSGESEAKIRDLFEKAKRAAPCIVFIDEIDVISPKRETAQREMERRIVAQLLTSMDSLQADAGVGDGHEDDADEQQEEDEDDEETASRKAVIDVDINSKDEADGDTTQSVATSSMADGGGETSTGVSSVLDERREVIGGDNTQSARPRHKPRPLVLVIGATNRPDALDPALRRAGRFDREIAVPIPSLAARREILQLYAQRLRLAPGLDLDVLAQRTPGYVGADLQALTREAAVAAVNRIFGGLDEADKPSIDAMNCDDDDNNNNNTNDNTNNNDSPEATASDTIARVDKDEPLEESNLKALLLQRRMRSSHKLRQRTRPLSRAELAPLAITMADFVEALSRVQPSAQREGFAVIPDVTWNDVGALQDVRSELEMALVRPIAYPDRFAALGIAAPAGVLLYGPPGNGKTLLAKAIANQARANFISIKGPELLDKYVGESEKAVRVLFARASAATPCIIFFDELDALCARRGGDGSNQAGERVVNQLLTEMDGVAARKQIYVVGATNRPDMIDAAMLRPGRLDKLLYVPLPDAVGRASILAATSRKTPLADTVDLTAIANDERAEGFSGADIASLVREAAVAALKESFETNVDTNVEESDKQLKVEKRHFEEAFGKVQPSVSTRDERIYDRLRNRLRVRRAPPDAAAVAAAAAAATSSSTPTIDDKIAK